ncbi:DUF1501 domain-containing protein [Virgisporangium aurantiacum]|uniref:DUF1501 domain-containing protein n=1 Tax=Virgisporangium aurantiacum TaxID=175570 RepID=A0A8J3YXB9_9ACTN|nr:DUF1501 domain-containing protein [Virgisporangium aurantiacum]GIJ53704.1 hypothetical protein Vau01_012200 [Virgisporangium aurantiacum]
MDLVTRRKFLVASGVVGGTALAAGAGAYTLGQLLETTSWKPIGGPRTLVLITLYGGNDGLATVIPYADPAYGKVRGELSYTGEQVLRLDDAMGLSPSLKNFKKQFDAGRLAIVRNVGYPKPDRSHFRSMDIWQTGQPARPGSTGWLGRWLDTVPDGDPRHAVTFERVLPPVLAGATRAGAAVTTTGSSLPKGYQPAVLTALGKATDESPLQARAARAFADLVQVDRMVQDLPEAPDEQTGSPGTGTGGRTGLAAQLEVISRCVEAGVATRVFSASLGGFDLHADGREAQENLLTELDTAVGGFVDRMSRSERGRGVVVAIYSEFGRRVRANASDGTDHGTASDVFLLGAPVNGGQYGEPPNLTDLDDGDLKFTTDFRDVYASLLAGVLDTDPGKVLDGWKGTVPRLL